MVLRQVLESCLYYPIPQPIWNPTLTALPPQHILITTSKRMWPICAFWWATKRTWRFSLLQTTEAGWNPFLECYRCHIAEDQWVCSILELCFAKAQLLNRCSAFTYCYGSPCVSLPTILIDLIVQRLSMEPCLFLQAPEWNREFQITV